MILMTLKTKKNYSLILDDEFIIFCELNNIDDIEKKAQEVFKNGFTMLKYGNLKIAKKKEVIEIKEEKKEIINKQIINKNNLYSE
jgi:hypothetical protein